MADQLLAGLPPVLDFNGDVVAGGSVTFYETNTTTPVAIWSDIAATIPLANPLTLDSAGRPSNQIFYVGTVAVKEVIKDAGGATLYTVDPSPRFSVTAAAASGVTYAPIASNPSLNVQDAIDFVSTSSAVFPSIVGNAGKAPFVNGGATAVAYIDSLGYGCTATGTNTISLATGLALNTLADGVTVGWLQDVTNTGAATVEVDNVASAPLVLNNGSAVAAGKLIAGDYYSASYDGTNWVLGAATGIDGTVIGATTPAAGSFTTADINGGTIDGTVIGGAVRSTALFSAVNGNTVSTGATGTNGTFTINRSSDGAGIGSFTTNGTEIFLNNGTAEALIFQTNSLNRMRISGTGQVAVGTDTPLSSFHLEGAGNNVTHRISTSDNVLNAESYILFSTTPGLRDKATIKMINSSTGSAAGELGFSTNNGTTMTERARIGSNGTVRFHKTTDDINVGGAEIRATGVGVFTVGSNECMFLNRQTTVGTIESFAYNGSAVGSISVTGAATAFNTTSDYRLKENIAPVQGAADIVKMMRPCTYTFKSDGSWADGFLAHELQELHPAAVIGSKDEVDEDGKPVYQGVDYSKLTPILTAALQEALAKIDDLTARIDVLEAKP